MKQAKDIFFKYIGSNFHMTRDGIISTYKKFSVSKDQEQKWINEMFENGFLKVSSEDLHSVTSLGYLIEHHNKIDYFNRFIEKIERKIDRNTNKYNLLRFAETIFSLIENLTRFENKLNKDQIINGIYTTSRILKKAKEKALPPDFKNPDFELIDSNLTQEQYLNRKISELEYKIRLVKILE
ncbi:hypothetical protein [Aestuariibaculum marinum]|uniref:Uncharacterized protein n=1 Tax=Aestuariibaculum marinum TaxID=2683592 RepID=A0A8J6U662_9FLAO|nr:hypothetical protein [Aestuariibaculum marinum]MBD0825507.1 hypothetical protein [Aestuariibaculum marinum]